MDKHGKINDLGKQYIGSEPPKISGGIMVNACDPINSIFFIIIMIANVVTLWVWRDSEVSSRDTLYRTYTYYLLYIKLEP